MNSGISDFLPLDQLLVFLSLSHLLLQKSQQPVLFVIKSKSQFKIIRGFQHQVLLPDLAGAGMRWQGF